MQRLPVSCGKLTGHSHILVCELYTLFPEQVLFKITFTQIYLERSKVYYWGQM